ncbi:MAG TPA: alpha/beta hydrolase [Candidatus Caenarcaniphilales bacterium]|nr:alpha/beta hydrolase [Candidatus Caenarcaniphilales bacterium]
MRRRPGGVARFAILLTPNASPSDAPVHAEGSLTLLRLPRRATVRSEIAVRTQDRMVRLRDGRRLGYAEYGDPDGAPVLFFHGLGTTRVICPPDDGTALRQGVRLVAVDRPGIGISDRRPGRRLLDWPDDVVQLANHLAIDRFAVVGWSGGGPYAAACGYLLPNRVTRVGMVSSPAPLLGVPEADYLLRFHRTAARAAGRAPWMIRLALWHWGRPQRRDPARFFDRSVASMSGPDQSVLAEPALRFAMIENSGELFRQGGRGLYDEALVLARRWGFDPSDIRVPVFIWHGEMDETVPVRMARYVARSVPECQATFYPDEGHHVLYRRWPEILDALR